MNASYISLYSRIYFENEKTKKSCCLPLILSILAVAILMGISFVMLYWNYYEQQNGDSCFININNNLEKLKFSDEEVKQVSIILDHWGKKIPIVTENKILCFRDNS